MLFNNDIQHNIISTALQGATIAKTFQDRAIAGERESNGLRAEVNQMASILTTLREEMKNNEKLLQKKLLEASEAFSFLHNENEKNKILLEESKKNSFLINSKLNLEFIDLERRLKEREKEHEKNFLERKEAEKIAIEIITSEHTNNFEKLKILNENNLKVTNKEFKIINLSILIS